MKKRIFNLSLVVLLLLAMILGLTACGDEDGDDKKKEADTSDAKSVIEAMYEAVNDQDASALADLTDFDALSKSLDEEVTKKSFKSDWEDFFEDNEDLEVTASKIKKLEDDEEVLDSLLEVYDSYDEYIEEIEDEYDIDNVVIYVAKLEVSEDYEDFFDDNAIVAGKDVIYLTKNDGEYQLIYSYFLMCLQYDYEDEYDY